MTRHPVSLTQEAREKHLRRTMTDAERRLWHQLKAHRLEGLHFRRQASLGSYIADFVCHARKLIIEVDGGQHNEPADVEYDARRTAWFESIGYRVLRFWNVDVLTNMEGVIDAITAAVQADTPPSLTLPLKGGGKTRDKPPHFSSSIRCEGPLNSPPPLRGRVREGGASTHTGLPVCCILAGGRALRMGGKDKALLTLCGKTLLDRIVGTIAPQVRSIALNANGEPSRFASSGLPVIADTVEDFAGPLAGILAGLEWAEAEAAQWMVSVPADTPFLPADLVTRLEAACLSNDIACAASGGRCHPVIGLWPVRLKAALRHALTVEYLRKVDAWTARCRLGIAEWPDQPYDPFFNINHPQDLAEAERILSEQRT